MRIRLFHWASAAMRPRFLFASNNSCVFFDHESMALIMAHHEFHSFIDEVLSAEQRRIYVRWRETIPAAGQGFDVIELERAIARVSGKELQLEQKISEALWQRHRDHAQIVQEESLRAYTSTCENRFLTPYEVKTGDFSSRHALRNVVEFSFLRAQRKRTKNYSRARVLLGYDICGRDGVFVVGPKVDFNLGLNKASIFAQFAWFPFDEVERIQGTLDSFTFYGSKFGITFSTSTGVDFVKYADNPK